MKNIEIQKTLNSFELIKSMKLGGKLSLLVAKNIKRLKDANDTYNEAREILAKQYCKRDESGNPILVNGSMYQFDAENTAVVNKEFTALMESESGVSLEFIDVEPLIEQFSDITPEQVEALLLMQTKTEIQEEIKIKDESKKDTDK
ncbi:MAG: hypothetical protein WCP65_02885 [Bacteroidota bacterium]